LNLAGRADRQALDEDDAIGHAPLGDAPVLSASTSVPETGRCGQDCHGIGPRAAAWANRVAAILTRTSKVVKLTRSAQGLFAGSFNGRRGAREGFPRSGGGRMPSSG
jgi:hypothetical protein